MGVISKDFSEALGPQGQSLVIWRVRLECTARDPIGFPAFARCRPQWPVVRN